MAKQSECRRLERHISDYVFGEMPMLLRAEMDDHLKECPDCGRKVADVAKLRDRIRSVYSCFAPPDKLSDEIIKGLPDPKRLLSIPRFGEIAIAMGMAEESQIKEALLAQSKLRSTGEEEQIGSLLTKAGVISEKGVAKILKVQEDQTRPQTLGGFEIQEQVGRGGMGVVYRAKQLSLDRNAAVKVLFPRLAADRKFVETFLREAHSVAQLSHPNIIGGIDCGEQDGYIYFAMEFVDGPTLRQWLKKNGNMPESLALELGIQIASALEYARKQNLIHRDIKPDNIMIDSTGMAKVCDLGLARRGEEDILAEQGQVFGTPHYLSPEQAKGEADLDCRSDIYSFGATLYHLVTGTTPFTGKDSQEIMSKHVNSTVEPPRTRNAQVSEGLDAIILKMMARDRDQRYLTPLDVQRDFELLKVHKRPAALTEKFIREGKLDPATLSRRGPSALVMFLAVAAALVAVLGGVAAFGGFGSSPTPTPKLSHKPSFSIRPSPTPTPKVSLLPGELTRAYEDLKTLLASRPDAYKEILDKAGRIKENFPNTQPAFDAARIFEETKAKLENAARIEVAKRKTAAQIAVTSGNFLAALTAFDDFPEALKPAQAYADVIAAKRQVYKDIEAALAGIIGEARKLSDSHDFSAAEKKLSDLIAVLPEEMRTPVNRALIEIRDARSKYISREGKQILAKLLDLTLDGNVAEARKLLDKTLGDPLFQPMKSDLDDVGRYIQRFERAIGAAIDYLRELKDKRVTIYTKSDLRESDYKVIDVKDDGTIEAMEYVQGNPKRTIAFADIAASSVVVFARNRIKKIPDTKDRGERYLDLAIYSLFCDLGRDAEEDSKAAAKLGVSIDEYNETKDRFRPMILNRFATKALEAYDAAAASGNDQEIMRLGQDLLARYGETEIVDARRAEITARVARAKIMSSGVFNLFKAKIDVESGEKVTWLYDFSSPAQLEDFSFDPDVWSVADGALSSIEDPTYRRGINHIVPFTGDVEYNFEYGVKASNSMCVRIGGNWLGVNSFNGMAGLAPVYDIVKQWSIFSVKKTDFSFWGDGKYEKLRYICSAGNVRFLASDKEILSGAVPGTPCSFEFRDLSFAHLKNLRISGKIDPAWLAAVADTARKMAEGKLVRGIAKSVYNDLNFGRRVERTVVNSFKEYFEVSPTPKIKGSTYSLKYEGYLLVPVTSDYVFTLSTGARTRLKIDGLLVHDNIQARDNPPRNLEVKTRMEVGLRKFELFVSNEDLPHQTLHVSFDFGTLGSGLITPSMMFSDKE